MSSILNSDFVYYILIWFATNCRLVRIKRTHNETMRRSWQIIWVKKTWNILWNTLAYVFIFHRTHFVWFRLSSWILLFVFCILKITIFVEFIELASSTDWISFKPQCHPEVEFVWHEFEFPLRGIDYRVVCFCAYTNTGIIWILFKYEV